mgnify:CR=1 FL=1|tara:strand:+ start:45580 stop:46803 length:1224 start_codon:yes stop_codon:yes gene_type:complete
MYNWEDHDQWPFVKEVCKKLANCGYKTYLAGGCVRDRLLGRKPNDFDIVTDARPDEIQELFEKTLDVGKKYGIIHVILEGVSIEVATFRKDGLYLDGRHPESIEFSDDFEDSERRDFTINSMFYDFVTGQIIDHQKGRQDLENQWIRCVGEPHRRFSEDHLRVLRAIRFSCQLGFSIESNTWDQLFGFEEAFKEISAERIQQEWIKILGSKDVVRGIHQLRELNYFRGIAPKSYWLGDHSLNPFLVLDRVSVRTEDWVCRLSALYINSSIEEVRSDLLRLKFPKKSILQVTTILQSLRKLMDFNLREGQRIEIIAGDPSYMALLLWECLPSAAKMDSEKQNEQAVATLKIHLARGPYLPKPLVSGKDLEEETNLEPVAFGQTLKELFWIQLENPKIEKLQLLNHLKR